MEATEVVAVQAKEAGSQNWLRTYRQLVTLQDGLRVCLRSAQPKDRQGLVALVKALPADELCCFRGYVAEAESVGRWAEESDWSKLIPLVAAAGEPAVIGVATLSLGEGWTRHVAELRLLLHAEYRRRGIGSSMLKAQLDIARRLGLRQVVAEVAESQPHIIHALENLGFSRESVLKDRFMTPAGETLDMVVLVHRLGGHAEVF